KLVTELVMLVGGNEKPATFQEWHIHGKQHTQFLDADGKNAVLAAVLAAALVVALVAHQVLCRVPATESCLACCIGFRGLPPLRAANCRHWASSPSSNNCGLALLLANATLRDCMACW